MSAYKLNVVFHGMFAFLFRRDRVEVLTPPEDDHVYKAGSWGRERRLREGAVYTLSGVKPGTRPKLDPRTNLIVSGVNGIECTQDTVFCSFHLPLPLQVTGLRRLKVDSKLLRGAAAPTLPETLPLVQVLTYAFDDAARLRFDPLPVWSPKPDGHGVANLHVWAESDSVFTEEERDHPIRGFERLMRIFPGVDLQLLYSAGAPMDSSVTVQGMEVWEQATLRERSRLLFGAPQEPGDGRGAELTNCLSLMVDAN
jgi:hypothetical protein